jgi:hypothetical protein
MSPCPIKRIAQLARLRTVAAGAVAAGGDRLSACDGAVWNFAGGHDDLGQPVSGSCTPRERGGRDCRG